MLDKENKMKFSDDTLKEVKRIIDFYPEGKQKSAILSVLHIAQKEGGGWLSTDTMDYVATVLNIELLIVVISPEILITVSRCKSAAAFNSL